MFRWNIRFPGKDDQLVSATFVLVLLIGAGIYFWQHSVNRQGIIDFKDMPSRNAKYLVDVNQADWPEFSNLPGIGEKLARQIVEHRRIHGPFSSTKKILNVAGIGPAKLKAMEPHLFVKSDSISSSVNEPK